MEDCRRTWHLVQISDGLDSGAVDFLGRLNIDLYRPLMRRMKPVANKRLSRSQRKSPLRPMREKIEPFFPGYAFVTFDEAGERWREIFKMVHIRGLVCANNLPVEIPFDVIDGLRRREIEGAIPAELKVIEFPFAIGERVRVADGPFVSFPGVVSGVPRFTPEQLRSLTLDELDESCRVDLLLDIFGRQTPVSLSFSQVEKF